ncbi:MAG TPA: CoB--CoM heterodisulfide reductase iron-sulfur subunit B family protein [Spirochaetota bacterium]|nr:CoB--CoM heterodisulfide reductase iron-sulfur subunit B family protein [Spirochaetota bacterium]HOD14260.1 CoB--CoM heterodisulfide reductase iron-sulfur subunit B family protein [Spirochaetota bacterium]HPG50607.1 CoB--CoM heterodisulfide reductase iron-sulfur subunit B family protein [Spirochaetota bacterium]HPN12208.1 CoB--CoM heterodisulfide reductase iron-sulfur subunit B family protein [Spirochaetota bacterium]HQL81562.1 CoB--CoM heterodisulfide reductase iron-sulfur subunit B family 
MTKIAYYPGCSLLGSSREYDESLRAIVGKMGFELLDVPDWNCCGASSAHALNNELSLALPARILSLAETLGVDEVLVPCAACYGRLMATRHELADNAPLRARINEITGMEYRGTVRPLNMLEFLECHAEKFREKVTAPFDKDVACYYGCLLVRPPKVVNFDRTEDPRTMDTLVEMIGAKALDWDFKVECCGAGHSISRTDLVGKLSSKIVGNAVRKGAQAIVVACPMCHSNLDMRRNFINRAAGQNYTIPVIYITQAIGLAMGLGEKELGLKRHIVKVRFPEKAKAEAEAPAKPKVAAAAATPAAQSEQTEEA